MPFGEKIAAVISQGLGMVRGWGLQITTSTRIVG
jgi:hypothetical protein